jgi:hypothetical protein
MWFIEQLQQASKQSVAARSEPLTGEARWTSSRRSANICKVV